MKSNDPPDAYLKTEGDHANQWGIYKSRPKWGIRPSVASKCDRSENQMSSNHPSSNARSKSSMSTTESGPQIEEASLGREHDDI
ncbi:hypothetical protein VitviT2T_018491 [Vitis vinifera]|uniref:Uncharacterized protein n=1 Tax=Vitis vinifera TaxID=29760 RepID=A0ABY9D0M8_VITVI|nr:hypothetical protein VitviT2T_018491 [Vitis vinifera]